MTTDRVLPEVVLPSGARAQTRPAPKETAGGSEPGSADPPAAHAKAATLAKPRNAALVTTPARAGVLIGVSAAVYAVTLATVAGLQTQAQADTAAQNQVGIDAVAQAKAANDALEAAVKDADAKVRELGGQYTAVSQDMSTYQAQLVRLSALVARIQGSAAALNANFKLPTVTMHGAVGGGGGGVVTTTSASGKP